MKPTIINRIIPAYLVVADFIIPIPLTIFMTWLWSRTVSFEYAMAIILFGLVFGYTIPGIAARFLRFWEFTWPFRIKYCYYHHGFIYSGYLSLMLWLLWTPGNAFTWQEILKSGLLCFGAMAAIGVHHDYFSLRAGMIINHTKTLKEGESFWKYISPVVVFNFGLIGLLYFIAAYWGYYLFEITGKNTPLQLTEWLILSIIFMLPVLIPYSLLHRDYLKKVFDKRKKDTK